MNRRTAIATAAAVTVTLLSGVVALGAHTGALGIGGSPAPAVAQPIAAPAVPATTADAATTTRTAIATRSASDPDHEQKRGHEQDHEHEGHETDD